MIDNHLDRDRMNLRSVDQAVRRAAIAVSIDPDANEIPDSGRGVWNGAETWARIVGSRLKAARILNGYSIEDASERLGYHGNKTQLSLIENSVRFAPIKLVISAAIVYGVPLDYLFGFIHETDIEEFGLERSALVFKIEEILARNAAAVADVAIHALRGGLPATAMARGLVEKSAKWMYAYDRFKSRNPEEFSEMPAGALLETAAVELADAAIDAERSIHRYDSISQRITERTESRLAMESAGLSTASVADRRVAGITQ